jgi:hypothetical protein
MLAKRCQNCCRPIEAIASNRTILICNKKQGSQAKYFVVEPNATCTNFNARATAPPPESDGARLIPLTRGKFAIVDPDDYDRLSKHKWCATKNGQTFYACRASRGKKIFMHHEIMKPPKGLQVDHIDRNALNNRKTNLRPCTKAQNNRNTGPRRNSSSKYKGVFWDKCCRKWCARIRPNRKTIYLGLFTDEIEAALAYDRKAEQFFAEFAYLNFPQLKDFRKHAKRIIFGGQTKQTRMREIQKVEISI